MLTDSITQKLTRARAHLLLNQPFFGTLCLRLKLMRAAVPTMATDGRRIVYDPAFVESLTLLELEAVLAHEVMHCALGHHCRRGQRDRDLWNIAADLAINPLLVANGCVLPAGALIDPAYDNLSAEEIYARLLEDGGRESNSPATEPSQSRGSHSGPGSPQQPSQDAPPSPSNSGDQPAPVGADGGDEFGSPQPGRFGEVLDATNEDGSPASPAETARQLHDWNIAANQAMQSAKVCGHAPSAVERPLQESRESKQDWRAILRQFVAATTPSDYRWTPPNRRFIASGLYLPSVARNGVGTMVIGVDTSGSIGIRELEQFAGEITAIADEAQPEAIHVVYCDAAVQSTQVFAPSEPILLEPKGGGGTDFRPVFQWVEQNRIEPACLIYLTDLCCTSYPDPPDYPVLWGTDSRRNAPFGETIQISLD